MSLIDRLMFSGYLSQLKKGMMEKVLRRRFAGAIYKDSVSDTRVVPHPELLLF